MVGKGESCLVGVFLKNPELTEKLGGGEGHFWRNVQAQTASLGCPDEKTRLLPGLPN